MKDNRIWCLLAVCLICSVVFAQEQEPPQPQDHPQKPNV